MIGESAPGLLPKTEPRRLAVADGAVCAQMVRCGKRNCRCARGELHGPYFYRFTRDPAGRLHKQYIKRSEAGDWRAMCERRRDYHAESAALREMCRRAVRRGGQVNMSLAESALTLAVRIVETDVETPEGEGLRRALITKVRDVAALIDLSQALRGRPVRRVLRRG